jgi:hypothetical protein
MRWCCADHSDPEDFLKLFTEQPQLGYLGAVLAQWSLGRQGAAWKAAIEKSVEEHHDGQSGRAQIVTITIVSSVVTGTCNQSC